MVSPGRTAVYEAYADDGSLLYVGMSRAWGRRWAIHNAMSPFFDWTAKLTIRWLPTREEAAKYEAWLIDQFKPPFNRPVKKGLSATIERLWSKCVACRSSYSYTLRRPGDICEDLSGGQPNPCQMRLLGKLAQW